MFPLLITSMTAKSRLIAQSYVDMIILYMYMDVAKLGVMEILVI